MFLEFYTTLSCTLSLISICFWKIWTARHWLTRRPGGTPCHFFDSDTLKFFEEYTRFFSNAFFGPGSYCSTRFKFSKNWPQGPVCFNLFSSKFSHPLFPPKFPHPLSPLSHYLSYKILGLENQNRPVPDSKKNHTSLISLALENFALLIA